MTLYEITGKYLELQTMLESGDIDEETYSDTVESLGADLKVENVCRVIKNLEASAKAYKEEKDRLAERQKTAENGVKRLKDLLLYHLQSINKVKVETDLFKVSVRASKAVDITDESQIPIDYLTPQPDKIDKRAIAEALKDGFDVSGARLVENKSVTIR